MRRNYYNSDDPEVLLRLKRQEADALRDVLRSINMRQLKTRQIFMIAQNTLMAQLGVRKMLYVYRDGDDYQYGMLRGIGKLNEEAKVELPAQLKVIKVDPDVHVELHSLGVEYIVPINYRNEVNAWFLVANFADTEAETENDLIFIETIGNIISTALENRALIKELVEQESLRRELVVAERIQQSLLVKDFSIVKEADIFALYTSHHKIGGDYYDLIPRSVNGFFVCIADVAGKGIAAALLMANLQANLRALILSENRLVDVVEKLHVLLLEVTQGEKFVTFFIANVRPDERRIDYINAGHNAPLHLRGDEIVELEAGTIPLGIVDLPYVNEGGFTYEPGDTLFLYTDGLVEQHNKDDEMFGEDRIKERLSKTKQESAQVIVEDMAEVYEEFTGKAVRDDDVTMMAIRL